MVQKIVANVAPRPAVPAAKKAVAKKAPAKKAASKPIAKTPVAKKVASKKTSPKKAVAKKVQPPTAKKAGNAQTSTASMGSSVLLQKMTESLRKMGDKRPVKQASLRRALKPLLGAAASDESIEVALRNLMARSVVAIGASGVVSYPQFGKVV